jgi:hypothetical protein
VALADNLCHLSILSPSSAFCSGVMLAAATELHCATRIPAFSACIARQSR